MIPRIRYSWSLNELDFPLIQSWLSGAYWSTGISLGRVVRGFKASSVVIGAFVDAEQVGVARALTDTTRFAYIADVFVDERYRGNGIGREMTRLLIEHDLLSDVDCCYLLTDTAHLVYEPLGFKVPEAQGKLMCRRRTKPAEPGAPS